MTAGTVDGWFLRCLGDEHQLWHFADGRASRAGVTAPERGPGAFFVARAGESIWDALRRETPWLDGQIAPGPFIPLTCSPGQFFPRMARPIIGEGINLARLPDGENDAGYLRSAQTQLEALIASLDAICRVVEPSETTLQVHGHEIRNLLILAATEVEMHMAGILVANGNERKGLNTKSYVKLARPLRLQEYSVHFRRYPDIAAIKPFSGWNAQAPTQSLGWYDGYNAVKHDRERQFSRASLGSAFTAVAACATMLVAQFGEEAISEELARAMAVDTAPWPFDELYVAPQHFKEWASTAHPSLA